jgi:enoyl-CoA hydratase/carnithine racemase
MILTGDPVSAAEAARIGLVNTVVPAGELLDAARDLAERITRHAPTAVTACLRAVTRGVNLPIDEALAMEAACFAAAVPTDGVRNGLRRFLDRTSASDVPFTQAR